MTTKDKLYHLLVNRVPGIKERYLQKSKTTKRSERIGLWAYLAFMNIDYYVFRQKKYEHMLRYPYYEAKKLYADGSESTLFKRQSPEEFAMELAKADVVSFDVFDTLIFRPFSTPSDLFFLLGEKLEYMDFKRIREEMEWKARQIRYEKEKQYEINLDEIYDVLSKETGLPKEETMQMELELEYTYCYANPYMKQVVEKLYEFGKKVVITSDMYLSGEQIKELLRQAGYPEFSAYYVSSDYGKSKGNGNLFEYVKSQVGKDKLIYHVGDNENSDIEKARKHGLKPYYYKNVNAAGEKYRSYDMSSLVGSVYRGLVNSHIHNGLYSYSREYEYGYIYGGLFVTGYCQFIHEYALKNGIDKILFLARDGDILQKAYKVLYPESKIRTEYVYWSRLAATKMAASRYKYDYFRRFLHHKVNQNYSLAQILKTMELEDMLTDLCEVCSLNKDDELIHKNVECVKAYLDERWDQVIAHYDEQMSAGKQYYSKVLAGCEKAAAVDIGWAGSGAITLDYIVNHIWNLECDITGIIAGTNTCHNSELDATETFLQSGKLVSYLYSQRENRDIWKYHDPNKDHNLYWEMLLDAPMGSFKGFYLDENQEVRYEFKDANADVKRVKEVQKGILDFVDQYKNIGYRISGRDAYAPMVNVEASNNKFFLNHSKDLMDDMNV